MIDPITYNFLFGPVKRVAKGTNQESYGTINNRLKNVINETLTRHIKDPRSLDILKRLDLNLANANDLIKEIKDTKKQVVIDALSPKLAKFADTELTYADDGSPVNILDFVSSADPANPNPTLGDIINGRFTPDVGFELTPETSDELVDTAQTLASIFGENTTLAEVLSKEDVKFIFDGTNKEAGRAFDNYVNAQSSASINSIQNAIAEIKASPFFGLQENLKKTVKNPVIELVASLASKTVDGIEIPKIKEILEQI